MPAATVVFTDIMDFSQKSTEDQKELVEALNAEVSHELRPFLLPPYERPQVIALPTGDGMALAFVHYDQRGWTCETVFRLVHRLQEWAFRKTTASDSGPVALRFGIHAGPIEFVTDINGRPNICGNTINYAQRVMDAANGMQVLLSEEAYRELVGVETRALKRPFEASFAGPTQVTVKHGQQIPVYSVRLSKAAPFWDNDDPEAKWWLSISPTPMPKERDAGFIERRQAARHVAFVQLTGMNFIREYEEAHKAGKEILSRDLERFWVFMPAPETYKGLGGGQISGAKDPIGGYIQKWKGLLKAVGKRRPNAELKLGLYRTIGFYASYLDWGQKGGVVHISPYIWGVAARDSPGFDLFWRGDEPTFAYKAFCDGLNYLHRTTQNIL
jgi:class 3 adenylate cyclase